MKVMNDAGSSGQQGLGKSNTPCIRVTATPGMSVSVQAKAAKLIVSTSLGKHIAGVIGAINDAILHAIPPVSVNDSSRIFGRLTPGLRLFRPMGTSSSLGTRKAPKEGTSMRSTSPIVSTSVAIRLWVSRA